jgi:aminopeptidase N
MIYGKEKLAESMKIARSRVLRASERTPRPVIDTTIVNLMGLLNTNSYQKGAWVLHMLRSEVGEDNFWKGMRLFYKRFRNGNAVTDDFRSIMEEVSGNDLQKFFHQWLYIPGQPDLKISLIEGKRKGTSALIIEQVQDYLFSFDIGIVLRENGENTSLIVPVSERRTIVNVKASPEAEIITDPEVKLLFRNIQE